ncbi:MAG: hypothetical protein NZ602_14170 [Thermoguttaceae bacterium]|nr:hypothetical protein [Thermoguttaceae bacterium]MDW8036975.1 hypothetical protein [Thermoguttaceae bacterium]
MIGWVLGWGENLAEAEQAALLPHPTQTAPPTTEILLHESKSLSQPKKERDFQVSLSGQHSPPEEVGIWVRLHTGRELVGHLDPRTTGRQLWLRTGSETLNIIWPISWEQVAEIRLDAQPVPVSFLREFLDLLLAETGAESTGAVLGPGGDGRKLSEEQLQLLPPSLKQFVVAVLDREKLRAKLPARIVMEGKEDPAFVPAEGTQSIRHSLTHAALSQARGEGVGRASNNRVAYLGLDAWIGQWDADVEADGLVVEITPFDLTGRPVPVQGILEVTLAIPPRGLTTALDQKVHRQRWVQRVRAEDFSSATGSAQYRLAFCSSQNNPEWNLDLGGYGALTAQLNVPGQGSFSATAGRLRVRPFSPVRDQLQQSTGKRFFPWEHTQP